MKEFLLLMLMGLSSLTYASTWSDDCRPGQAALEQALKQIGNEKFDKNSCQDELRTCLILFKENQSLGTSIVYTVKLEALSGNVYEFEVNSSMSIFDREEACKVKEVKLTKFY